MDFDLNRRTFLKVLGGAGLATLAGCGGDAPVKRLLSQIDQPEELVPGVPTWYASLCRECPAGCGIVVATLEGKPIKIEGNPLHPTNRGAVCARGQAALQGLYHPGRTREALRRGPLGELISVSWEEAVNALAGGLRALRDAGSLDRAALITPPLNGSLAELVEVWSEEFPGLNWYEYEAISHEPLLQAGEIVFGRRVLPRFDIGNADLLVSFGADFLETWISPVQYAAAFARMRTYREGKIGRMIYVGSRHGLTAANSDEAIFIKPGTGGALALGIIHLLFEENLRPLPAIPDLEAWKDSVHRYDPATVQQLTDIPEDRIRHLARLLARSPRPLVLPGGIEQSANNGTQNAVAVYLLDFLLGAFQKSIEIPAGTPRQVRNSQRDLSPLLDRMKNGDLKFVLLGGVNPAYSLPPSAGFGEALGAVETVVCCSDIVNESSALASWVLPIHHPMESWGDGFGTDGILGLMQPVVKPQGDSKSLGEIFLEIARAVHGDGSKLSDYPTFYEFLTHSWTGFAERVNPGNSFQEFWESVRQRGGLFGPRQMESAVLTAGARELSFREPELEDLPPGAAGKPGEEGESISHPTLVVYPSLFLYDGRGADRPWLQEVPDPMLQRVWGSSIEVPRSIAKKLDLRSGDVVRVNSSRGSLELPVFISERGHRDVVSIALGQGRGGSEGLPGGTGVNALNLLPWTFDERSGGFSYLRVKVQLEKTGRWEPVPTPQGHPFDEGRGIARSVNLSLLRGLSGGKHEGDVSRGEHEFKDLLEPHEHPQYRWGMVIDLNACIGCSACVVACYAENNIPIVGREQYLFGREMGWNRVERYFDKGGRGGPDFVPMLCQQCDNAPCEPVCPVFATYHTPEGLNAQVYNRCVGTRYCANNCPYSVRRFNWFTYPFPEPLNQQLNPNVTVRTKGVMEKCTFCVQRIAFAKDRAKDENRKVRDGEVLTACSQSCPTRAITFGDLKDPDSEVSRKSRDPRAYKILEHLNTKPAVTYLKKISAVEDLV